MNAVASLQADAEPSAVVADQRWYKDAIIYQVHVKSFFDSNDDGIGDFPGLISKLDYIAELGVDTIWLLPFYPSPRRDDGYDIAEYMAVHPDYGSIEDFEQLVAQAHARGIRIVTELVINHTSDQHPWFQRARTAPAGSPGRDFYVWSDTDQEYEGTRIIFCDTEKNPTGPGIRWPGSTFWHRFYSHQPDLNFDNPAVLEAVLEVMRFWLDRGVDGLRLDAVPYLIERAGTSNEKSAGNPCHFAQDPRHPGCRIPGPHAAGRSQHVAGRHPAILRPERRRMPHGIPLPADAAHVHGNRARRPLPHHGHHAPDPGDSRELPVGDIPAQPR